MKDPVIIVGAGSCGSSIVTGVLEGCGLSLGKPLVSSLKEHVLIRSFNKRILNYNKIDPLGQDLFTFIPPEDIKPPLMANTPEKLRCFVTGAHGGDTDKPWGFKECKTLLLWRLYDKAFPNAIWVYVHRDPKLIAESCMRRSFFRTYHTVEDWETRARVFEARAFDLMRYHPNVYRFEIGESKWEQLAHFVGLEWNPKALDFYDPSRFTK